MIQDREQRIRERAHAIWEQEGRPDLRHEDHWHQASQEISDYISGPQGVTEVEDERQRTRDEGFPPKQDLEAEALLLGHN